MENSDDERGSGAVDGYAMHAWICSTPRARHVVDPRRRRLGPVTGNGVLVGSLPAAFFVVRLLFQPVLVAWALWFTGATPVAVSGKEINPPRKFCPARFPQIGRRFEG
jgi:hypothetical protein